MLVAEPGSDPCDDKLTQFFRDGQAHSGGRWKLWIPPHARLDLNSPWRGLAQPAVVLDRPLANPDLLVLSTAADWHVARRFFKQHSWPTSLQLLMSSDARTWGHGAAQQPAIRVAAGDEVAHQLRAEERFAEPLQVLPLAFEPSALPQPAVLKDLPVVILACERPELGQRLQMMLRAQGIDSLCALEAWPRARWQDALARAEVAVLLPPAEPRGGLGQHRLAAMALGAVVVSTPHQPLEALLHDGKNSLLRSAEAESLATAVAGLLAPDGLIRRQALLAGAEACVQRHGRALERLCFLDLLNNVSETWQEARRCHAGRH